MTKLNQFLGVLSAALLLSAAPALAHDEHCHKTADGKLADVADAKNKKACVAQSGTWFHRHQHCHKAGEGGKPADLPGAKTEKACTHKGGQWTDHGHNAEAPAAAK